MIYSVACLSAGIVTFTTGLTSRNKYLNIFGVALIGIASILLVL